MTHPNGRSFAVVFKLATTLLVRNRRIQLFWGALLLPFALMLLARLIAPAATGAGAGGWAVPLTQSLYFQLLIPVMALVMGTDIVASEIDHRTLVYLVTTPTARGAILTGKFASFYLLTALPTALALFCWSLLGGGVAGGGIPTALNLVAASLLAILAYGGLFTLLGVILRRAILPGIAFVFGWEGVVQYFPGITQKFTVIHWVKSLLPPSASRGSFLIWQLEPSSRGQSVGVLLLLGLISVAVAAWIFSLREYPQTEDR